MRLLERAGELDMLRDRWQQACAGQGAVVVIVGEPGAGKTALAQAFTAQLALRRPVPNVLWGTCTPLATPAPLEPLRQFAHHLGPAVQDLVESDAPAFRLLPALVDALDATPSVVVLDDLQWADQATADLLRLLLRRIDDIHSLIIGTLRDDVGLDHPMRALAGDVARSASAYRLPLGPLSRAAVADIVSGTAHDPDEVLRLTGGNAFFVQEVAASAGDGLPATVRDAVLARIVGLPPAAHEVLALMACAPEAVPDTVLPALGVDLQTLRSLDETGLLQRGQRGLRFRHELCRLAVAETIPPGGEVSLHARVLRALEDGGHADPAVLTHHALGAGNAARVLRYAPLAGRRAAAAGAHTQATALFEAALAQDSSITDAETAELLELLARELYLTDRLPDAIAACTKAMTLRAAMNDLVGVGTLHRTLSLYEWYSANRDRAELHAGTAVDVLERFGALAPLGRAYATEAYLALQRTDLDRVLPFLSRVDDLGDGADESDLRLWSTIIRGVAEILAGGGAGGAARAALLEVSAAGFAANLDEFASAGYTNLAYCDVEQRQFSDAAELLALSLPLTVERDLPVCHAWQLGARGRLGLLRGDWADALRDADAVLASRGALVGRAWAEIIRGLVELRRDEGDPSSHLDTAWELASRLGEPLRILPAAAALAERAWLTGIDDPRIDQAVELLRHPAPSAALEWSAGDLAVWLVRMGRAVPDGVRVAPPHQQHLAGDPTGAAAAWARIGEPYAQALALVDTRVDAHAVRALELLDNLGASAVAGRVRRDLRARGLTTVPAGPRAATRANPAGLTGRQLEVLALLANGLSNAQLATRLFISPKTVDHHISAILAKLQAASRSEAVHVARTAGIIA